MMKTMGDAALTLWLFLLVIAAVGCVFFIVWRLRARGLSAATRTKVKTAWAHARGLHDPVRSVLEADKVLDLALRELGYSGSLADKLKRAEPRFSDHNAVWRAHKLRNRLAHETGAQVTPAEAARALKAFERGLKDLGM